MKKQQIILYLFLIISTLTYSQKTIQVEANFNGRNCRGRSFQPCGISFPSKTKANNTTLQVNKSGDLMMVLKKSKFTLSKQLDIVSKKTKESKSIYVLENTFVLDDDIRLALKLPKNIGEIPKGTYPITETKDNIIITFKLR